LNSLACISKGACSSTDFLHKTTCAYTQECTRLNGTRRTGRAHQRAFASTLVRSNVMPSFLAWLTESFPVNLTKRELSSEELSQSATIFRGVCSDPFPHARRFRMINAYTLSFHLFNNFICDLVFEFFKSRFFFVSLLSAL